MEAIGGSNSYPPYDGVFQLCYLHVAQGLSPRLLRSVNTIDSLATLKRHMDMNTTIDQEGPIRSSCYFRSHVCSVACKLVVVVARIVL